MAPPRKTECGCCGNPKDGKHASYCKACFAEYQRAWRRANPKKAREITRLFNDRHPEKIKANNAKRKGDPEWQAYSREWAASHVEERRDIRLKGRYKLTLAELRFLMEQQGHACVICGRAIQIQASGLKARTANVDHDHESGLVRGVLCGRCNTGLGCFEDDPDRLLAAAFYIERHRLSIQRM